MKRARDAAAFSVGTLAQVACILEVTAPKAGNVRPNQPFGDTTWTDFLVAAAVSSPVFDRACEKPLGDTVLDAVTASCTATGKNVNLGIVLLLAPLAAVPVGEELRPGVRRILGQLGPSDCSKVYEAIRRAEPGGLGEVPQYDVRETPPQDLLEAMAVAEERDLIAHQYTHDFEGVFDVALPLLRNALGEKLSLERTIVLVQLELLERYPDSLIARKCGETIAREASRRAATVLRAGWPLAKHSTQEFQGFDRWLREDGNRRNPGTTADMIAATLFLALRTGIIEVPV